ncbi:MAG: DUF1722 domain-containing protein [Methylococcales bacterium]
MQLHTSKHAEIVNGLEDQITMHQSDLNQNAECNLNNPEILIGVSSGLLSENKNVDKMHNTDNTIIELLSEHFVMRSFFPEAEIDLGVVKQTAQLHNQDGKVKSGVLLEDSVDDINFTRSLAIHQNELHARLSGYIFKQDLSSNANDHMVSSNQDIIGIENSVYVANFKLGSPLFPVIGDQQLANPSLKENFIQRVCVMHRWQQLAKQDTTIYPLIRFHRQHHHLYVSHDPNRAVEIETILSLKNTIDMDELHTIYIQAVTDVLNNIPSKKNHVIALQQLLSVIEPYLTREDQQEVEQSIEHYCIGKKSIKAPLTLLRYHVSTHTLPGVFDSAYLFPYSQERILCLQNEAVYEIGVPIAV